MKPKKRQKLCYNCDGDIDVDVIVCPFCAADLREERPEERYSSFVSNTQPMDQEATLKSLYPASPKMSREALEETEEEAFEEDSAPKEVNVFTPTVLFTLGVQLSLFGVLMLLFSHHGVVILKWDARYWFFYLLASFPFLFFGYRAASRL